MRTYADRTREMASKAVANQVSTPKGSNSERIVQRVISRDFNASMLNVAGETHYEASREEDKELISRYGLSPADYYQEHELGTSGINVEQSEDTGQPSADPALLRALQAATLMQKDIQKLKDNISRYNGLMAAHGVAKGDKWRLFDIYQRLPEESGSAMGLIMKLDDTVKNAIPRLLIKYNHIYSGGHANRDIDRGSKAINDNVQAVYQESKNQYGIYRSALDKLEQPLGQYKPIPNAEDHLQALEKIGDSIMLGILKIVDQKKISLDNITPGSDGTHSKVVATRSFYMNEVANELEDKGKKGLWKIGNDHVNDLVRNRDGLPIRYNLIPGDAYRELLQKHGLGGNIIYKNITTPGSSESH